ncbi:serum amyloid P-component-like [Alosa pseudoharengus]|uniref:serum amyloid P-component-like n=1 Tax=Alosa pseudoharengus TaxID=34774 RepID=UPI003F8CA0B2
MSESNGNGGNVYATLNMARNQPQGSSSTQHECEVFYRVVVICTGICTLTCVLLLSINIEITIRKTGNMMQWPEKDTNDMKDRQFCFPEKVGTSYVKMMPAFEEPVNDLTLCMRFFSKCPRKDQSLFSLATTSSANAFLLFIESSGLFSFSINDENIYTNISCQANKWNSVCSSWSKYSGETYLWLNDKRVFNGSFKSGHGIGANPIVMIGQDQDKYGGGIDVAQNFVGMVTDVYLWQNDQLVRSLMKYSSRPNVQYDFLINWRALKYTIKGDVSVISIHSECKIID